MKRCQGQTFLATEPHNALPAGLFVYMDFRNDLSPQIVETLESSIGRMSPRARIHAQMLITLGRKDPVPAVIALLDDPKWKDKNLAMFELRG